MTTAVVTINGADHNVTFTSDGSGGLTEAEYRSLKAAVQALHDAQSATAGSSVPTNGWTVSIPDITPNVGAGSILANSFQGFLSQHGLTAQATTGGGGGGTRDIPVTVGGQTFNYRGNGNNTLGRSEAQSFIAAFDAAFPPPMQGPDENTTTVTIEGRSRTIASIRSRATSRPTPRSTARTVTVNLQVAPDVSHAIEYQSDGQSGISQSDAQNFIRGFEASGLTVGNDFQVTIEGETKTIGEIRTIADPEWNSSYGSIQVNFGTSRNADNKQISYRHDSDRNNLSHAEIQSFISSLDARIDQIADASEKRQVRDRVNEQTITIEGQTLTIERLRTMLREGPQNDEDREIERSVVTNSLRDAGEIRRRARADRARIRMIINSLLRSGNLTWELFMTIMDLYGLSKATFTREAISYVLEKQAQDEERQEQLTRELREISESRPDNYGSRVAAINQELQQIRTRMTQITSFLRDAKAEQDRDEQLAKSLRDSSLAHKRAGTQFNV